MSSSPYTLYLNGVAVSGTNTLTINDNKLTGLTAPTAATDASTKGYVDQKIADTISAAPDLLNTLNELATAIGGDPNFASSIATSIGNNTTAITDEVSRATAAELVLRTNLAAEATTARAAEGVLTTNLASEVTAARAAEGVLRTDLAAETTRATAAEGVLTTNLASEVTTARAAELVLRNTLTSIQQNTPTNENFDLVLAFNRAIYDVLFNNAANDKPLPVRPADPAPPPA